MKKINLKQFSADAQNIPEAKALSDLLQNEFKDNEEIAQYDTADLMTTKVSDLDGYQTVGTAGDLTFSKNENAPNGDTVVVSKGDDIINAYTELPESEETETADTGDTEIVDQPVEEDTQDTVAEFSKDKILKIEYKSDKDTGIRNCHESLNIQLKDGTDKPAKDIKIGDEVKFRGMDDFVTVTKIDSEEYDRLGFAGPKQFSKVDGDSPAFKAGQEFAKTNPGLDQNAVKAQGEAQNYSGDDLTNFEFGYNSIEKAADLTEKQTGETVENTDIKPEDNPQGGSEGTPAVDQESKLTPASNVVLKSKIRTFSKQCSKPVEEEPKKTEVASSEINIVYGAKDPEIRQFSKTYLFRIQYEEGRDKNKWFNTRASSEREALDKFKSRHPKAKVIGKPVEFEDHSEDLMRYEASLSKQFSKGPDTSEFTDVDWSMISSAIRYRLNNDKKLDSASIEDYKTILYVIDPANAKNVRKFSKPRQPKLVYKQFSSSITQLYDYVRNNLMADAGVAEAKNVDALAEYLISKVGTSEYRVDDFYVVARWIWDNIHN